MIKYFAVLVLPVFAQDSILSINIPQGQMSGVIKLMGIFTLLSFGPAILMTMTSFTRFIIIFGLLRTSLGLQGSPPNIVLTGLAIFLTFALMSPVFQQSYNSGIKPFLDGTKVEQEALSEAFKPFKKFMLNNVREKDLELFMRISAGANEKIAFNNPEDIPISTLLPAFVISEITLAFSIGFFVAVPFLIIDLVVASVLASMSMITLPPIVISLPIKLMLFVLIDGWRLIILNVLQSYQI